MGGRDKIGNVAEKVRMAPLAQTQEEKYLSVLILHVFPFQFLYICSAVTSVAPLDFSCSFVTTCKRGVCVERLNPEPRAPMGAAKRAASQPGLVALPGNKTVRRGG